MAEIELIDHGSTVGKFCKHFLPMGENKSCAAGVEYAKAATDHDPPLKYQYRGRKSGKDSGPVYERRRSLPCFKDESHLAARCPYCVFPTPEEVAAEEKEWEEMFSRTTKAREAIVAHLGGPWKKGMAGSHGGIKCPCCEAGELRFTRSGYNGHIHAVCSTEGCVQWME